MEQSNLILVPWDFSQVAEYALQHAIKLGNIIGSNIMLLHVVKKEKEIEQATEQMLEFVEETQKKYNVKPNILVREGNIFKTISQVADELTATLVIMGTHGMKGMQKFTGSWALKVIAGTEAPFVVVQAPPEKEGFKNIVFPVDFRIENKEKLRWAHYLSQYFDPKFHICKPDITDELILKKTRQNLFFAKKFLDERAINYEINTIGGVSDFADATIKFAQKINADLILIMTTKNITFQDYVLGANEQQIIANTAKIPVMCVNPRQGKLGGFA